VAQDFAKQFYHSPAWLRNSKIFRDAVLDRAGHVLSIGRDGYYYLDNGTEIHVPDSMVVPPGVCERCFAMGRMTPAKLVHHKVHLSPSNINDQSITLSYDNMQRLCQDCHAYVHSGNQEPRVEFDDAGNPIPKDDSFMAMVERATAPRDEIRNIHRRNYGA